MKSVYKGQSIIQVNEHLYGAAGCIINNVNVLKILVRWNTGYDIISGNN